MGECDFRLCDGFRMPAHNDAGHAHRGPVSESRQGRKARDVGRPARRAAMGIWGVDAVQRGPVDAGERGGGQGAMGRYEPDGRRNGDGCGPLAGHGALLMGAEAKHHRRRPCASGAVACK